MTLHHVVDGDPGAPAILLASSLGATQAMWEPQVEPLQERFRVVRCDRRGHGASPVVPGPTTIDDLGRDLVELLDSLGLDRVAFCGLSLGGLEGMWLALHAPERIERLVLACTSSSFAPRETWIERAATVREEGLDAIADGTMARWFSVSFRGKEPGVVTRFREMLVSTPADGYVACCDVLADADLTDELGGIATPTLVLTGSDDPTITPARGDELARRIPGARHVTLEGAAHLANVDSADTFTPALIEHLEAA
ncbi:MAG TPA: 3-oxoadipate enol-lactonase [Gaiella sp.]|jgi:3-oxoadipate enol-lactonase|nr:3-oxoadipate enol-lactonase [Gaiella sp.]